MLQLYFPPLTESNYQGSAIYEISSKLRLSPCDVSMAKRIHSG